MISLLIPSRGRRDGLLRTINSALETASSKNLEFIVYVDEDDLPTYDGFEVRLNTTEDVVHFVVGKRIVLSNTWNKCAEQAHGDILFQGNDDILFVTHGWDVMVEREFAKCKDRILMVHGNDGSKTHASAVGKFGPHPFVSRRWYDVLGYMTAPYYSSDYGDTHINELANAIGRRRYLQFTIEHLHFWFGKAPLDKTSEERLARHNTDRVDLLYKDLFMLREIDIEKLKAAMQSGQQNFNVPWS